jgi:hypothetical protein
LLFKYHSHNIMKYFLTFSFILLSCHFSLFAQQQSLDVRTDFNKLYKSVDEEYGFDQVLVNGVCYEDKYWKKIGHQFLMEDRLYNGSLVYKDKIYKGVDMKYDIFDQQLIIYANNNNSAIWIVPPIDFISSFSFGNKSFSKYNFGGVTKYYQVVFDKEKLQCLYYWFKEKRESNKLNYSGYNEFTDSEKENFLSLDGSLFRYKNNKSFINIFPVNIKGLVKEYLSNNHINVTNSSDEKMKELLTYCSSLL